jgi:hypothetical protein
MLDTMQVPMDQPLAALEMITSFTRGEPLKRVGAASRAEQAAGGEQLRKPASDAQSLRAGSLIVQ